MALYSIVAQELGYDNLSTMFSNAKDPERFQKRYQEALRFWNGAEQKQNVILNTETVWGRIIKSRKFKEYAPQLIDVIDQIFSRFNVINRQIYLHLRLADEYCESSFSQLINGGSSVDFESYYRQHFLGDTSNKSLQFLEMLDERFGLEGVTVIPFTKDFLVTRTWLLTFARD